MTEKVELKIAPAAVRLMSGDTAEIVASIRNLGQTIDQLTVSVEGIGPDWYTLPVSSVALFPNDQDEVKVVLHPPDAGGSRAGSHPFRINVASKENPGQPVFAQVILEIGQIAAPELEISPERVSGRTGAYQVRLRNPLNSELTVNLEALDARKKLKYFFGPEELTAAPGGEAVASLQVKLGVLAFFGAAKEYEFQVGAALPVKDAQALKDRCPHCGHRLRYLEKEPPSFLKRIWLDEVYKGASVLFFNLGHRFRSVREGAPVFCHVCTRKVREDSPLATARFASTPWLAGFRARIKKIKFPRFRFPSLTPTPVIQTFAAGTKDRRDFKITWTVNKARTIKLNGADISAKGEMMIRPTAPVSYTITAVNRRKTASRTIEVQPQPLPAARVSDRTRVSLAPAEIKAFAGVAPMEATLSIQNLSEIVDKFVVEIEGIDQSWCVRSAASVALMPQATDQVQLSFQPPKAQGVRAGEYPFAITVHSQSAPGEGAVVVGTLEVLPSMEFKMDIRPKRADCRRKSTFQVSLANTGVSDIDLALHATDMDDGCKFKFKAESLRLIAWDTIEVPLAVKPKRWWGVGDEKRYDITVNAACAGADTKMQSCGLSHKPFFRSWKTVFRWVKRLIVLAGVIIVLYFLIKWGGGWSALTSNPGEWGKTLINTFKGWF